MPTSDPNITSDLPGGKPDQDPAATTDRTRQGGSADPNTVAAQNTGAFELGRAADGARSGSFVPAIPDYEIEGELGRGGMGVVYRARQSTLNRLVAIKMILGGKYTDPMAQARFLIEAEVIAAIQHPHVVQLYQFGRHDDQPFFVLEFVGGGSLAGKLKIAGRFSSREAAAMVAKLADGMAAAHQKGVVHRDLKPGNVLLMDAGEPKITDFGLAKMGQADMTATGSVMGTPSYMSPEQAEGKTKAVGTLTDVYALGAILYELTTGQPPFSGATMMATIQQVLTREPERPRALHAGIPRDLETICLKCLEKDAKKRYATALDLAADLRAFLDGRPIAARRVGSLERTWKWAKRNPGWAAGIAIGLLLLAAATGAGFAIHARVEEQRKANHATDLVQAILNADTAQAPILINEMTEYRKWADPLLREECSKAADKSRQKLHASLALLPVDAAQVNYLFDRLLDASPHEVPVIRDALAPHKDELLAKLWAAVAEKPEKDRKKQRLPAAAALAKYDPDSEKWATVQADVADDLVKEPAVYLANWMESLRPVRVKLLGPLSVVLADSTRRETERSLASDILADYATDQPDVLANLVMDADVRQFAVFFPKLKDRSEEGLPALIAEIDKKLPPDAPSSDERREKLGKRQANAAAALLKLNQPATAWQVLKHRSDPRARSYLIHWLSPLGVSAKAIAQRLDEEPDVSIRRALMLSLGEFSTKEFSADERQRMLPKLRDMYRTSADPGLHAACEWLLRSWKQEAWLKQVNEEWAKDESQRRKRLEGIQEQIKKEQAKAPPQWYVNTQGQTMVVLPGPATFTMGSPKAENDRRSNEIQHQRRISRTFAIAANAVTKDEFLRFNSRFNHNQMQRYPKATCPIGGVTWHEAAAYCNWLSKKEGIAEEQWCFEIKGNEKKLKENYLKLSGYRLPTEAEMEYATRAGAVTSRYFGESEELLSNYAWYLKNSKERTWPVGSLKPNDMGLFDAQGNVYTWCQEAFDDYPAAKVGEAVEDAEGGLLVSSTSVRVLRGGAFFNDASVLRSAFRGGYETVYRDYFIGFRTARTLPPGPLTAVFPTAEGNRK